MNTVGRIVVREGCAGVFLPVGDNLPSGLYEVKELLGEYHLIHLGKSLMEINNPNGYKNYDIKYLMDHKSSRVTPEEWEKWEQMENDNV
jgi:hypothetical protein